jgi:hypothetical protein
MPATTKYGIARRLTQSHPAPTAVWRGVNLQSNDCSRTSALRAQARITLYEAGGLRPNNRP